jgi:dihydrofolate reductase
MQERQIGTRLVAISIVAISIDGLSRRACFARWSAEQHEFAAASRRQPKWVVSRSLRSVGPNATLVEDDVEAVIRDLKARLVGEIAVSGPDLARSLTDLGLIDEYRLYFHPLVLGRGKPFFAGPRPPLRLVSADPVGEDTIRLTYSCLIARLARRTAPTDQARPLWGRKLPDCGGLVTTTYRAMA